jgi:hypothetical protein
MKTNWFRISILGLLLAETANAALTTNSWFLFSGKWENGANWSAGIPSSDDAVNTITNDLSSITVTIDTGTVTQHVINSCMTISNLVVGRGSVISHTLFMNNANNTPGNIGLTILNSFTLNATGILSITNSDLRVTAPGGGLFDDGTALLNAGNITVTNLSVGRTGAGTLTVSNGTLIGRNVNVAQLPGSRGTLTIAGGTTTFRNLSVALSGLTGTVWMTGGQLTVSNEPTAIGDPGIGKVTVSNGVWKASIVSHRQGTLTIAGGTHNFFNLGIASGGAGLTATVWMVGGNVATTNPASAFPSFSNDTVVAYSGIGVLTMSNGTFLTRNLCVASNATALGTFTLAGGTNIVTSRLTVGGLPGAAGAAWITGGRLAVTNAATIVGQSGVGELTMSNGTFLGRDLYVGTNSGSRGILTIAGGTVSTSFSNSLNVGYAVGATGEVWVTDGLVIASNGVTTVGFLGRGQITLSNGVWHGFQTVVGRSSGSRGTLTIAGGTHFLNGILDVGLFIAATGSVWITGGELVATNSGAEIGVNGVGQLTISNGVYRTLNVVAGLGSAASGTLTFAGGTTELGSLFLGSNSGRATGTVWVTGGELVNAGGAYVGLNGVGRMTVSNGTWQGSSVLVAQNAGSKGNLNIDGGTNLLTGTIIIGHSSCSSTGIVTVTGGSLFVTNVFGFGSIDIRSGTFTISGGLVQVDTIILTNSCAHFARTGGTLIYSNAVLTANRDDDGDGIPNGYEQSFGLDPLDPADAGSDPDGDGQTSLQEFLAGTNPTNSASFLGITAIAREVDNIRVTWMTGLGKTNALERSPGAADGSYSNNFSAIFTVTNTVGSVTNYLDMGAVTNKPALYYRVRLVP